MSVRVAFDSPVIDIFTRQPRYSTAPGAPFLELTTPGGARLIAFAEPTGRGDRVRDHVAHNIMAAVETQATTAGAESAEALLECLFASANRAVRERNRKYAGADPLRRVFCGLVIACLERGRLVIGLASPGQAVVIQGSQAFAFPAIPGFSGQPANSWTAAPLGMFAESKPVIFETTVKSDDLLLLGGRGLAQALDPQALNASFDGPAVALEAGLEQVLATSAASGNALIGRIGDLGEASPPGSATPIIEDAPPPAPWNEPVALSSRRAVLDDDLPEQRLDRWHTKAIDASERWFARKTPAPLPLDRERRKVTAVGASSVQRFQPRRGIPTGMRTRLPRAHLPWMRIAIVFALTAVLGGGAFGYSVRQARASRQTTLLAIVQAQFEKAKTTKNTADGLVAVAKAESALRSAENVGAADNVVHRWRGELNDLRDALQGIHRFTAVSSFVVLPGEIDAETARVIQTDSGLFIVGPAVYRVDSSGAKLTALLRPGAVVDGRTAGSIIHGASDGGDLVVTDGKTLFRWNPSSKWTAAALPATPSGAWTAPFQGAYLGNFYLLDPTKNEILKFGQGRIDADPTSWLNEDQTADFTDAAGFAIDGGIYVLHRSGALETLFKGESQSTAPVSFEPGAATEVGLVGGPGMAHLYVLEHGKAATRLIRIDPKTGERVQFQVAGEGQANFSQDAVDAFSKATSFAVNESAETVVFLSDGRLWSAALPQ